MEKIPHVFGKRKRTGYLIFLHTQMLELDFWGTAEERLGLLTLRKES